MILFYRSYYDDGGKTEKVLRCAKNYLEEGHIKYVFFATDSEKVFIHINNVCLHTE